jgi:hypothetical protein
MLCSKERNTQTLGQNTIIFNVKTGATYSNHSDLLLLLEVAENKQQQQ